VHVTSQVLIHYSAAVMESLLQVGNKRFCNTENIKVL